MSNDKAMLKMYLYFSNTTNVSQHEILYAEGSYQAHLEQWDDDRVEVSPRKRAL